ncbi:serpin-ZX-like isoform X1 [Macadamia integrifolia]|uniref:serpin-ZX-like isoform X1 n=1 Tax=Macadamia integrifolia TaxID=60698 RepID=UPI001C4F68D6|nr:serpin-ZX-like isoform X1 [Macadamia integrifolia]
MDFRQSISSQTSFSLEIAKNVLLNEAKDSNIVFSPLSIHVVLSLIAAGSKGPTLDQMLSFLRSKSNGELNSFASEIVSKVLTDGSQSGGPRLSFANGVWMDKSLPLKASFKEIVDKVYKAVSMPVDFQAKAVEVANEVNSWADKETNGLIKEVLPPGSVDCSTRLIFANALYFKGAWNQNFDASKTNDYDFYLVDGSSVHVPFMTSKKKQYVRAYDGFKVLRLPYKQGEDKRCFSMYFFLPDAKDRLPGLVEKLTSELGFLDRYLPSEAVKVGSFRIPRFKISFGFESSEVLKGLGLVLPFAGGLTEMVDSPLGQNLAVSSIFQKSFIEVNEEGTEAAAASAGVITLNSIRLPTNVIDFVADHPFIYLIREEMTGVVLFIGHVLNPLQAA